jgi:hypothetical protein
MRPGEYITEPSFGGGLLSGSTSTQESVMNCQGSCNRVPNGREHKGQGMQFMLLLSRQSGDNEVSWRIAGPVRAQGIIWVGSNQNSTAAANEEASSSEITPAHRTDNSSRQQQQHQSGARHPGGQHTRFKTI